MSAPSILWNPVAPAERVTPAVKILSRPSVLTQSDTCKDAVNECQVASIWGQSVPSIRLHGKTTRCVPERAVSDTCWNRYENLLRLNNSNLAWLEDCDIEWNEGWSCRLMTAWDLRWHFKYRVSILQCRGSSTMRFPLHGFCHRQWHEWRLIAAWKWCWHWSLVLKAN